MLEGILVARALELRKERNIGKFDDCKSFQDYRRKLGDLPFDNNSRARVAVVMVDVWTNQIQKLEHTIMTTMGLEYKQALVDPKKDGSTEIKLSCNQGCIAGLLNGYKNTKFISSIQCVCVCVVCLLPEFFSLRC